LWGRWWGRFAPGFWTGKSKESGPNTIFSAVNNVLRTVDNWVDCHLYRKENKPIKLVKQELLTLPQHMSSPPVFIGVRVTQSLFFCVMLWMSFVCHFGLFFGHCDVCPSIYRFWLPLWEASNSSQ
jgi:hypothetical protein